MKILNRLLIFVFLVMTISSCQDSIMFKEEYEKNTTDESDVNSRVIYGEDDRLDVFEANEYWKSKYSATVALMRTATLENLGNGITKVKGKKFGDTYGLCSDEPFREQMTAAFCSGSLVAPNIIMTAGHCVRSFKDCSNTRFVFGFGITDQNASTDTVKTDDIYSCKELIKTEEAANGADFALIKLDRSVPDRSPLDLRQEGLIAQGEALVVIGHPSGIPAKISGGATVRSSTEAYLIANLDTYGGNSGSAVFNEKTGLVEGILVRGETDFVFKNGCRTSNRCSDTGCRGEDVTRIDKVVTYLNSIKSDL